MSKPRIGSITAIGIMFKLVVGCWYPFDTPVVMPQNCKAFFMLSRTMREREILKYPIEQQFDFYICGMILVHPPQIELSFGIAKQGEKSIPFLVDKLKKEKDERVQMETIRIFFFMSPHYYDIRNEDELIDLLKKTISTMREPWCRNSSEEFLNKILGGSEKR